MRTPKKGSKVTTDPKETIKKIPTPRMVKLNSGEQLVAIEMVQDNSNFIRLEEPYIIQLHPYDLLGDYMMEEKMTIKPWLFKAKDKVISIHKSNILCFAVPTDDIAEYYMNIRTGKLRQSAEEVKKHRAAAFGKLLDQLGDVEYDETQDYLMGKKTVH